MNINQQTRKHNGTNQDRISIIDDSVPPFSFRGNKSKLRLSSLALVILLTHIGISFAQSQLLLPDATEPASPAQNTVVLANAESPSVFLRHNDTIPDFARLPDIVSVQSGNWSDPVTWSLGRIPQVGEIVEICHGHTVTYDMYEASPVAIKALGIIGHLKFKTNQNTRLKVGTIIVKRLRPDLGETNDTVKEGHLEIGSSDNPVGAAYQAEVIFADQVLNAGPVFIPNEVVDPQQWGNGLIVLGKVTMHGATISPTFSRTTVEPLMDSSVLTTEATAFTNWKENDELIIPDTRALNQNQVRLKYNTPADPAQWESLTLDTVIANQISLNNSLVYDHKGARDGNYNIEYNAKGNPRFLPHVANISRNVIIRSENTTLEPTDHPEKLLRRGHTVFTHRADVDIRYVRFDNLGRTLNTEIFNTNLNAEVTDIKGKVLADQSTLRNQIARYAFHTHHLMGPVNPANTGYQYHLIGCAITNSSKWGAAIHGSHYGCIKDNVVYNASGAGISFEDGSESQNVCENNFIMKISGNGQRAVDAFNKNSPGSEGCGIWLRGVGNFIRNNVVANVYTPEGGPYSFAYVYFQQYVGDINRPTVRGQMMNGYETVSSYALNIRQFEGNEAYGAMQGGLTYWWIGAVGVTPIDGVDISLIKDLTIWHNHGFNIFAYPSHRVHFDNLNIRGDVTKSSNQAGFTADDYMTKDGRIYNSNIQGVRTGIKTPLFNSERDNLDIEASVFTIRDTYLNNRSNIEIATMKSVNGTNLPPKKTVIKNVQFDNPSLGNQNDNINILMNFNDSTQPSKRYNFIQKDEVYLYQYNGDTSKNYRIYYDKQVPSRLTPADYYNPKYVDFLSADGAPTAGYTNQQNYDDWHYAHQTPKPADRRTEMDAEPFPPIIAGAIAPTLDNYLDPALDNHEDRSIDPLIRGIMEVIPEFSDYLNWKDSHGLSDRADDDDQDGDNMPLLGEYYFGLNPLVSEIGTIKFKLTGNEFNLDTSGRTIVPPADVNIEYQSSENLKDWTGTTLPVSIDDKSKLFLRMKFTRQ